MPDPSATAEYHARMKMEQAIYDLAVARGLNPDEILESARALFTLSDRLDVLDLGEVMEQIVEPIIPSIGHLDEYRCLFYRGRTHTLLGNPSAGKTLMMQYFVVDEIKRGNKVMWIDTEESSTDLMHLRLEEFGLTAEEARGNHVILIDRPISQDNRDMLATLVREQEIALVVIDSFGELLGVHSREENDDSSVTWMHNFILRPLAEAGAAVVTIDHPTKTSRWMPAGSKRKNAAITGATYTLNPDCKNEEDDGERGFSMTKAGYSNLFCVKDRPAHYPPCSGLTRFNVDPNHDPKFWFSEYYGDSIDEMVGENRQRVREDTPEAKVLAWCADGSPVTSMIVVNDIKAYNNRKQADELLKRLSSEGKLVYSKVTKTFGIPLRIATIQ